MWSGRKALLFFMGDTDNDNNLLSLMTKYDNDYEFAEFSIIGRKDDGEWSLQYDVDKHGYTVPSNDAFHFAPLENDANEFRGYFQVPDELAENTEKVELVFNICGKEVIYSMSEE